MLNEFIARNEIHQSLFSIIGFVIIRFDFKLM